MDVQTVIADAVRSGPIQGSQLAQIVRSQMQDWTPQQAGARSLRDYVDRFVPGVAVVGRSGMDVIYGAPTEASAQAEHLSTKSVDEDEPVNLWRVWVSPNSPHALSIDPGSGAIVQVPRAEPAMTTSLRLEPAAAAVHEEIAADFVRSLPPKDAGLASSIGGRDGWWFDWQRTLRSLGLESAWHEFRSASLETRLRSTLDALALAEVAQQRAFKAIISDRSLRRVNPSSRRRESISDREILERALVAAIPGMDESALREIKVPLGVLLDVVSAGKLG